MIYSLRNNKRNGIRIWIIIENIQGIMLQIPHSFEYC